MPPTFIPITLNGKNDSFTAILAICGDTFAELQRDKQHFLHTNELQYFNLLRTNRRRYSYLLGRCSAKYALKHYLEHINPAEIEVKYGVFHQPIVHHRDSANTQISISHSGSWAASLAFPEACMMAVDVEVLEPLRPWDEILCLSLQEKKVVERLDCEVNKVFTLIWTAKEAISKALKTGFTTDPRVFEIEAIRDTGEYLQTTFTYFPHFKTYSWYAHQCCWTIALPENINLNICSFGKIPPH